MKSAGGAFDSFFQAVVGGDSGSQDSAVPQKGSRPPRILGPKGKSQGTSHSGSKGTPRSKKRKFGLVFAFPDELCEGDLNPTSNKEVSHLACCFYYSIENVTSEVAKKADKMSLNQRYGQALRATQEVGFPGVPRVYPLLLFFTYLILFSYTYILHVFHDLHASFLFSHCLPDLDSLVATQSEVDKLKSEVQSHKTREDQLAREVKAL